MALYKSRESVIFDLRPGPKILFQQTINNKRNGPERKEQKEKTKTMQRAGRKEEEEEEKKKKTRNKNKPATEKRKERKKTGNVSRLLIHVTSISLCYLNWV